MAAFFLMRESNGREWNHVCEEAYISVSCWRRLQLDKLSNWYYRYTATLLIAVRYTEGTNLSCLQLAPIKTKVFSIRDTRTSKRRHCIEENVKIRSWNKQAPTILHILRRTTMSEGTRQTTSISFITYISKRKVSSPSIYSLDH